MKLNSRHSRLSFVAVCAAILVPASAFAADLNLEKAPPLTIEDAPQFPDNLARFHFGAGIAVTPQVATRQLQLSVNSDDTNKSEAALLCDDPTVGYQLSAGPTTLLVSLANVENIQNISLANDGARGSLTIAVSSANVPATSPAWKNIFRGDLQDGAIVAASGSGEAKYVKLTFDVTQPGRVSDLGVYANAAVADFTMPRPRKVSFENDDSTGVALIRDSFTDLHLKARALYASSGDLKDANKMLDDQAGTAYQFAPNDTEPTAVIDLGRVRSISRISAVYATQPGSVDFYVLNDLPVEPNDAAADGTIEKISNQLIGSRLPQKAKLSAKHLAGLKPVGSVANTKRGRASINFPAATGRYVMLKWHPANSQNRAFSLAQVAAFGPSPRQTPTPEAAEGTSASAGGRNAVGSVGDGKELADGKSILDNKDIPAEAPEAEAPREGPPPTLPGVPPFTFIPRPVPAVPPVSP